MSESKNEKLYANIAAICFTMVTAYKIWIYVKYGIVTGNFTSWWIAWILYFGGLAVLLFMRKKNIGFTIIAVLGAIVELYFLIKYFDLETLLKASAYISFLLLLMINTVPSLNKYKNITKTLGFVPFALLLLNLVIVLLMYSDGNLLGFVMNNWDYCLFEFIECSGFLFVGMWLRESVIITTSSKEENKYSTFNSLEVEPHLSNSTEGADKLKMYKNLLDSGVITQEEFEEKKKNILGL